MSRVILLKVGIVITLWFNLISLVGIMIGFNIKFIQVKTPTYLFGEKNLVKENTYK